MLDHEPMGTFDVMYEKPGGALAPWVPGAPSRRIVIVPRPCAATEEWLERCASLAADEKLQLAPAVSKEIH